MNLILKENKDKELTVTIEYPEYNSKVEQIVKAVKRELPMISGEENGRCYRICADEVLYIEHVDRKTFVYTNSHVYKVVKSLIELEKELKPHSFIRVSKSCLLNINALEGIKTLPNSKIEARLTNGEKVIVSRTYIAGIKKAICQEV